MLTRRQARVLGLTTGDEASSTVNHSVHASTSPVCVMEASTSDDARRLNPAADGGVHATASVSRSPTSSINSIVLRLSAPANGGSGSSSGNYGNTQLSSTVLSSGTTRGNGGHSAFNVNGHLGVRQAEAMRTSVQGAIDFWSAAGTTAGPAIQLATKYGFHKAADNSLSSLSSQVTQRANGGAVATWVESGNGGERSGQAAPTPSSSTTQRPPRLTTTQLRARWRGVMRNCTTLHTHPRSSATSAAAAATAAPVSSSCLSPPPPPSSRVHGASTRDWQNDTASLSRSTPHVLRLSHTAEASSAEVANTPECDNNSNVINNDDRDDNTALGGGVLRAGLAAVHEPCGAHRDRTASPEASSRRNATFFISPFHGDVPSPSKFFVLRRGAGTAASPTPHMLVRRPLTALAFRQQTQVQMHARQQRLVHEVHYRAYVKVHEARMRMLFGLDDSVNGGAAPNRNGGRVDADKRLSTHSGPAAVVDPVAAGEAAYLDSLDASKSEEEARVLQVIASIDAALKRQLASAYQRSMDDCGVSAAACSERKLPGDHTVLLSGTAAAQTPLLSSSPSSPASFALRRPAIVEAVIASTTQRVEAFVDQLLPYQQEGVRWLLRLNALEHMNGILADDMGLGKTAQTVVYLSCYKDMLEQEVQRPLEVLHARHTQLCQRALGLAIVGTELAVPALPSWLSWCASATVAEEVEEGGDGRGDSRRADSSAQPINGEASFASITSANAPLTAARACGRSIQLVKEVKRWLWQLDEAGERDGHTTAAVTRASSPFAFSSSPLPTRQRQALQSSCNPFETSEQQQVQQCDTSATATTSPAVNVVALVPIKRRRGRPSKHLSAMMTAAALAAGGSTQPTSSARSSLTSSPAPQSPLSLSSMIAHQCQLSTCSSALDARLDREWSRFRPVLIIAPLSTLPHWNAEFRRFSRRGAAAGGERGKGAAVAPSPLQNSSGAPLRDTQERFTAYVLNGPRGEREERMRAFLEHTQGLEEPPPQSPVTPTTAPPQASMTTPVLVIPHDMLTKPLSGPLRQISRVRWHVVVIDEAQRIKSAQSSLFKKVCLLDSISRLVLTGTPLQNNTTELFSLLQFLAPQSFTSSAGALFEQLDSALMAASRSSALEDRELHLLLCRRVHRLLMPFILRREKTILKAALPPLRDYAVLCPLLPFQAAQLAEVRRKHEEGTLSGNPHIQYRKILLHPYTTQAFFYVDEQVVQTSGKLLVLDFMMRFLQRTRHKFLVFCGWTLVLDVVETLCGMRGIPYVRLDGKTPVEKREANIEGFNRPFTKLEGEGEGESINGGALSHPHARRTGRRNSNGGSCARTTATAAAAAAHGGGAVAEDDEHELAPAPCCFLISKVAGGVGLNLQAADAVFLLDVDYNPQRDAQALSRVYRVGQTREVRVFRLVIDHPIERNIVAIHEAKENLGRAVVQAGRYDLHSSVQEREAALQQIFRAGTLSKLSEQLSMTSPTVATASEATATVVAAGAAAEEDGPFEAVREKDGEDDDVEDCGDASVDARGAASSAWRCGGSDNEGGTAEDEDAEVDEEEQMDMPNDAVSPTSMQTPTDLHRVFLNCPNGPLPSALKKPKTETTEDDNHDKATVSHTITNAAALEQIRLQRPQPQPQPHRKRRHISFKLENDTEEYSKDSSHSEDGEAGLSTDGDPRSGIESKVLGAETPSTAAPGGKQDDEAHTPTAAVVPPAAHLLAMRERLEEVLLRHDGERGVLQDMFRTLEASLAAAK